MVSGLFLGSVLRGVDEDQQAADEDVSVSAGRSGLPFTLIRAYAEHSHIKRRIMSFMHFKRFNIKHVTMLMRFKHIFFWLSRWCCFLIFHLKGKPPERQREKNIPSVWHPHPLTWPFKEAVQIIITQLPQTEIYFHIILHNPQLKINKIKQTWTTLDCWKMV